MLSAARTASLSVSPPTVSRAASCIFSSTYAASRATYAGSRPLRIGYCCPWISTFTILVDGSSISLLRFARSEIQALDLREHLVDARTNEVALLSERRHLGVHPFRFGHPRLHRIELAREPRIVVGGARVVRADAVDHADQQFDLLFEPIDRLELHLLHNALRQRISPSRLRPSGLRRASPLDLSPFGAPAGKPCQSLASRLLRRAGRRFIAAARRARGQAL